MSVVENAHNATLFIAGCIVAVDESKAADPSTSMTPPRQRQRRKDSTNQRIE